MIMEFFDTAQSYIQESMADLKQMKLPVNDQNRMIKKTRMEVLILVEISLENVQLHVALQEQNTKAPGDSIIPTNSSVVMMGK